VDALGNEGVRILSEGAGKDMIAWMLRAVGQTKKLLIVVVGFTVLLIGVAMIVLPGPAIIVVPLGLGILSTEFIWAAMLLKKIKGKFQKTKERVNSHETK
jgi:tellurite resistance protein TerC